MPTPFSSGTAFHRYQAWLPVDVSSGVVAKRTSSDNCYGTCDNLGSMSSAPIAFIA